MKIRMGISLFLVLAVVFASPTPAQTIHSLLIIDDAHPLNADQYNASKDKMERLLHYIKIEAGIPFELSELRSDVDEDGPEWMSIGNIGEWLLTVDVNRDDVVFVYFSGRGSAHRWTRELYLHLPHGGEIRPKTASGCSGRDSVSVKNPPHRYG